MSKFPINNKIIYLLAMVLLTPIGYADVYKWVDDDGHIHYGQTPPKDGNRHQILKKQSDRIDHGKQQERLQESIEVSDELRAERQTKQQEQQAKKQTDLDQQAACERAKKRYASFQRPRVNLADEDGNTRRIGEEERQAKIKEFSAQVEAHCSKG